MIPRGAAHGECTAGEAGAVAVGQSGRPGGPFSKRSLASYQIGISTGEYAPQRRDFGFVRLTLFGIGTTIGLGIFVVTGQVAALSAGPAVALSFLIAGILCGCAALCYAELASIVPVTGGSAYVYAQVTLGELAAWLIAWNLLLEYVFGGAALAIGWSGYFVALCREIGIAWPASLSSAPLDVQGHSIRLTGAFINLPAVVLVLASGAVIALGASTVARFGSFVVGLKLVVVLLVITVGLAHVTPQNWLPFIPARELAGGEWRYGLAGILSGVGLLFYSFLGFDTISTVGQEARNPGRTIPAAIIASLLICLTLYVLMSLTLTGLVPFKRLNVPAPIYTAIEVGIPQAFWLKHVVSVGGTIGLCSGVIAALYAQSRLFLAVARDGLLPSRFAQVHAHSGTPILGVALSTAVGASLAGTLPIELLGEFVSAGTLLALGIVSGSVIYLRLAEPDAERPFKVPYWPVTSSIAVLGCSYFLVTMSNTSWIRLLAWMALGSVVYFFLRYRRVRDNSVHV